MSSAGMRCVGKSLGPRFLCLSCWTWLVSNMLQQLVRLWQQEIPNQAAKQGKCVIGIAEHVL